MSKRKEVVHIKKRVFLPAIGLVLVAAALFGAHTTYAQDNGEFPSLVQKIAEKFGLKEADVQAVFDESRAEKQIVLHDRMEGRLDQAVADGKITDAQKQAILEKMKELHENRQENLEQFKNMTPDDRRSAMQQKHDELKSWAEEQGIDMEVLSGPFGKGHMFKFKVQ